MTILKVAILENLQGYVRHRRGSEISKGEGVIKMLHLFNRNLIKSPNCTCGVVKSTSHFLLFCPKYTLLRNEIIFSMALDVPITVNVLLYGSNILIAEQNVEV